MPSQEHFARNWEIFKQRWIRTSKVCKYPKIAACYITRNSEEFIEASIRSIYDIVSKIIIVDNDSKDKTLNILENFNDPYKKIIIISRKFKDKTEQRNVYCEMLQGFDYAWIIDSDEVWSGEDLRKVEHLIFSNPQVPAFCFNFYDFWKDLGRRSRGVWEQFTGRKSLINLNLTGKIKYNSHILPICEDGRDIPAVFVNDIYFHHYSYVRTDEQMREKFEYYLKTGTPGFNFNKDWYNNVWLAWDRNPTEVETKYGNHMFGGGHTELFNGEHPEVMKNHPRFLEYIDKYKTKINMTVSKLERPNFINISLEKDDVFDISKKLGDKKPYLVLIEDILEHISFNTVGSFLVNIYDRMELGGEIVIKALNFPEIIKGYAENKCQYVDFIKLFYGNQENSVDYHSCIYDKDSIKVLLEDVGFSVISIDLIENGLFLYVVARKDHEFK